MTFPLEVKLVIQNQFASLLAESEKIRRIDTEGFAYNLGDATAFHGLRTRFLSLLYLIATQQGHWSNVVPIIEKMAQHHVMPGDVAQLLGMIRGLEADYKAGMITSLDRLIEANMAGDYLGQAENLLKEGQSGKYDHVPAAVLTGAILEDALRRLCQRQNPPIPLDNAKGEPKTLNPLIEDLKKAGLYNELKAKQLRSWAATRNHAAHGEFTEFNRQDVEQMLVGVQNFLADYL